MKTSRMSELSYLVEPFRSKVDQLIGLIKENNLPFFVFETGRTPERQRILFKAGKSKTLKSLHLYGLAADFVMRKNGNWTWSDISAYKKFGELVHQIDDLTWGGDWKMRDYCHIEMKLEGH